MEATFNQTSLTSDSTPMQPGMPGDKQEGYHGLIGFSSAAFYPLKQYLRLIQTLNSQLFQTIFFTEEEKMLCLTSSSRSGIFKLKNTGCIRNIRKSAQICSLNFFPYICPYLFVFPHSGISIYQNKQLFLNHSLTQNKAYLIALNAKPLHLT